MSCGFVLFLDLPFPGYRAESNKMLDIFFRISARLFPFEQYQASGGLTSRIM
jgi:hypothetical protein